MDKRMIINGARTYYYKVHGAKEEGCKKFYSKIPYYFLMLTKTV
jgi:hypothetical protein